ncbi:MAG: DUF4276 family protein, partial [Gammaproteobacteria bacterium]|nr:DUF4276 family protein [Gammaproteobacteria bacterium]
MIQIASIVEGSGEVKALPVLLRRLDEWLSPTQYARILSPIKVRRDRFLNKEQEFRRQLLLAAGKCGADGWILVLLDADDDCPAELSEDILQRACTIIPHRRLSVVLAKYEYEAWFLAAASSLHGQRNFSFTGKALVNAEGIRNAKNWLGKRMGSGNKYRE